MTRCGSWCTVTRASGIDLKKNDGIRRTYARRLDRVGNPTSTFGARSVVRTSNRPQYRTVYPSIRPPNRR